MIALSTAWNADRTEDGAAIIAEITRLGITHLELNFSLTAAMVRDIARLARQHHLRITSLHNYCPIPEAFSREDAKPDCFSLSSLDEDERRQAVDFTRRTISTARELGAIAVVLHTGRVEIEDRTRDLIDLANKGKREHPDYWEILDAFRQKRQEKRAPFVAQILKSLEALVKDAEIAGVALGVENRFYYREIPSIDEFKTIFDALPSKHLGYWHDVGHAVVFEELGLIEKGSLLKNFGPRLLGLHLHNVKGLKDHRAPMDGIFDMNDLKPYVRPETLKVIEAHSQVPGDEIKKSVAFIREVLGD